MKINKLRFMDISAGCVLAGAIILSSSDLKNKFKVNTNTQHKALMQDSVRTDSLCKKAYFEGAQMMRDSIKNTIKTVK